MRGMLRDVQGAREVLHSMNVFSAEGAANKARRRVTAPPEDFSNGNAVIGYRSDGEQCQS